MNRIKTALALSFMVALSACTRAGSFAANIPYYFDDTVLHADIVYDVSTNQKLDIYVPSKITEKKLPVVVFFYGGGYQDGHKDIYRFVADTFVKNGYMVVIPDYRKFPAVKFPSFVEDGAKAIAWTTSNASKYGGDPSALYLTGHSAGAHIGALLLADKHYLKDVDVDRKIIKAFAGLAGPYDFVPDERVYKDIFGPPENYPNMQVPTFVDGTEAPMLLLWGADDKTVYSRNHERLKAKIEQKGGIVEVIVYPSLSHISIIGAMTWLMKGKASVQHDILSFFQGVSKP